MVYLVSFSSGNDYLKVTSSMDFEIIDEVCDEVSLIPINNYIMTSKYTKNLPLVNGLRHFKENGRTLIFFFNHTKAYFIIDSNHINYKQTIRNKLLEKILE